MLNGNTEIIRTRRQIDRHTVKTERRAIAKHVHSGNTEIYGHTYRHTVRQTDRKTRQAAKQTCVQTAD